MVCLSHVCLVTITIRSVTFTCHVTVTCLSYDCHTEMLEVYIDVGIKEVDVSSLGL